MWWSRRLAVLVCLALCACGFAPVYGPGGSAEGLHGQITVDAPRDAAGFAFVRHMETRLGISDAPVYRLSAELSFEEKELGITTDQVISRYQLVGRARYALIALETQETVSSGEVDNFTSYTATGTPFATRTARQDARDRLMIAMADQIIARLLVTGDDWR